jgi:lipopolysaccharide transport protein LptA
VTNLTATAPVQVDLPAEGTAPAKRIRATTLAAAGEPGVGLRGATFGGGVEYRETRAARRNVAAVDRTARSETLVVETQPGLGAIQKADFKGNVRFTDPPDFVAQAQHGIYDLARDRLSLLPAAGQPGPASPTVTDANVSVAARTITFSLSTRELEADTAVRSTIDTKNRKGRGGAATRVPAMLADDEPVNVTSNRLVYSGAVASAVYTGKVTLWQGTDTTIKADTITIDDRSGNLTADGNATTAFVFVETDRKTGAKRRESTTGSAARFEYDDGRRMATYTGTAHVQGPTGDVTGEKIELTLQAEGNELERAEAFGANGAVQVREGDRLAKGAHLTYTAADERYVLVGAPVEIIEARKGTCTLTLGTTATFNRATEQVSVTGTVGGRIPATSRTLTACPPELIR